MHSRFHRAFAQLPSQLQATLGSVLDNATFAARLTPEHISHLTTRTGMDEETLALHLLPLAAACAQTPHSDFQVGAIARGISGHWYFGANMEFLHAPLQHTVHAEQSAITHAWLCDEPGLEKITVNYSPCGHCRQFMNELNSGLALQIQLPDRPVAPLKAYLPDAFGPDDLGIATRLMDPARHDYIVHGDQLAQAAISAANLSYAPYSQSHSGIALMLDDGSIVSGRYAENAAFNPSLPPLQSALILLTMQGKSISAIQRATLAECPSAPVVQRESTHHLLNALGCKELAIVALYR